MLKTVLVGVNSSAWSRAAADLAVEWARVMDLEVTFLGVVDAGRLAPPEPVPIGGASLKAEKDARLLEAGRNAEREALDLAADRARQSGVRHTTHLVTGDPEEELGREAQRHDLLIIGRRAEPESDHQPAASDTLTSILRSSVRPVVVTTGAPVGAGPVVVAYDGSHESVRALGSYALTGLYADAEVHLLAVGNDQEMTDALTRGRDFLVAHGRTVEVHILPVGRGVAESLLEFLAGTPARLLVMGVYGETRLRERLFGSVSTRLLTGARIPLFLDH